LSEKKDDYHQEKEADSPKRQPDSARRSNGAANSPLRLPAEFVIVRGPADSIIPIAAFYTPVMPSVRDRCGMSNSGKADQSKLNRSN
jgi:hypothetical protein